MHVLKDTLRSCSFNAEVHIFMFSFSIKKSSFTKKEKRCPPFFINFKYVTLLNIF